MNLQRAGILAVAFGGVAVWLVAGSREPPSSSSARRPTQVHAPKAEAAVEITRLHLPLRSPGAPLHTRNLFRYTPRTPAAVSVVEAAPGSESAGPSTFIAPAPFTLAGLAEDQGPEGPVRTAIISGMGELFLVKKGEAVTPQYLVTTISLDQVELTDVTTGSLLHLKLK